MRLHAADALSGPRHGNALTLRIDHTNRARQSADGIAHGKAPTMRMGDNGKAEKRRGLHGISLAARVCLGCAVVTVVWLAGRSVFARGSSAFGSAAPDTSPPPTHVLVLGEGAQKAVKPRAQKSLTPLLKGLADDPGGIAG